MNTVADSITNVLWEQGFIKDTDIDKCAYGLDIIISSAFEIISILVISVFLHNFLETVVFFGCFIPLRIYAGGYHAKTRLRCLFVSIIVYMIFTTIIYITPAKVYFKLCLLLSFISLVVVFVLAPIIHSNKNVNKIEKRYYRKKSLIVCFTETSMILILVLMLSKNRFVFSMALGQAAVTFSMIAVSIKNKSFFRNDLSLF